MSSIDNFQEVATQNATITILSALSFLVPRIRYIAVILQVLIGKESKPKS